MSDGPIPPPPAEIPPQEQLQGGGGGTPPPRTRIDIPGRVFVRAVVSVVFAAALLRFFAKITGALILIALSLILAAILDPLAGWFQRRGLRRGLASALAVLVVLLVVAGLLALVIPPLVVQGIELAENLPYLLDYLRRALADYPGVYNGLERAATRLRENPAALFTGFLSFGLNTVTVIFSAVVLLTLAMYFLTDKERIRGGVLRHVPLAYRERAERTLSEGARAIQAYFVGQVIVSFLFALYIFILLTIFGVPYATVLAVLGFFLDALPTIGSFFATLLPTLLALTRSLTTAIIVLAAIMTYTQIESNLISPRVLGGRLKIPPVLTMIAFLVGGQLFGILGIIIFIPLAGMVPVIDRIWFTGQPAPPLEGVEKGLG